MDGFYIKYAKTFAVFVRSIQGEIKEFLYNLCLDNNGYYMVIPMIQGEEKDDYARAYRPDEVIKAALGDVEAKAKIDSYNSGLKKIYNRPTMLNNDWQDFVAEKAFPEFKKMFEKEHNPEDKLPTILKVNTADRLYDRASYQQVFAQEMASAPQQDNGQGQ